MIWLIIGVFIGLIIGWFVQKKIFGNDYNDCCDFPSITKSCNNINEEIKEKSKQELIIEYFEKNFEIQIETQPTPNNEIHKLIIKKK